MSEQVEKRVMYWLTVWKAQLEHPDDILLAPSLINILDHSYLVLEKSARGDIDPNNAGWASRILALLRSCMTNKKGKALRLIDAAHPSEMAVLKSHLSSARIQRVPVLQALRVCRVAPDLPYLFGALINVLIRRRRFDRVLVNEITHLMLRRLLFAFGTSELAKIPVRSLIQACVDVVLPPVLQSLSRDTKLGEVVVGEISAALTPKAFAEAVLPLRAPADGSRGQFIDWHYSRRSSMSNDLEDLATAVARELKAHSVRPGSLGEGLASASEVMDTAIASFLDQFRQHLLAWVFGAILADDAHEQERGSFSREAPAVARSGRRIAATLDRLGWFSMVDSNKQDYLAKASAKYLAEAAAHQLAATCLSSLPALDSSHISAIQAVLITVLRREGAYEADISSGPSVEEMSARCRRAVARKDFHSELLIILHDVQSDVLAAVDSLLADPIAVTNLATHVPSEDLWRRWSEWFTSYETQSENPFGILPWHLLTDRQIRSCLRTVQKRLLALPSKREVFFTFKGLDFKDRFTAIAGIKIYDADAYNFGEDELTQTSPGALRAHVSTVAVSNDQARLDAFRSLGTMLDTLVFVSSSTNSPFGFNPQVDITVAFREPSNGGWASEWRPLRGALSRSFTAGDQFLRIAGNYETLLQWEAANRQSLASTYIDAAFFRALHWYRKGRWAADPTDTFLFEWVGLESLFSVNQPKDTLFVSVPQLYVTWSDIDPGVWSTLDQSRQERIREILTIPHLKARLDADPTLSGWERDNRVLLQPKNASRVLQLIPKTETIIRSPFVAYSRMLHRSLGRTKTLHDAVALKREGCTFRLRYLYALRNQIVHEAALPGPETVIYADSLETMFYDVLTKIARTSLNLPGAHKTIADTIQWYQQPFL